MNIGLSGGGLSVLFYGISIFIMGVREIARYIKTGQVTPELKLALEQLFYLACGILSLSVLFHLFSQLLSAKIRSQPAVDASLLKHVSHIIVSNALGITIVTIMSVWGTMWLFQFIKGRLTQKRQRTLLRL